MKQRFGSASGEKELLSKGNVGLGSKSFEDLGLGVNHQVMQKATSLAVKNNDEPRLEFQAVRKLILN